ncbi:MAG: mechanosensitive ion channel family protein [Deltaproteobacteria bacterium]|nr:mechanosensitive ion channel family protein [Deltaproteobacteria bacterium]
MQFFQHPYFLFPAISVAATALLLLCRIWLLKFVGSWTSHAGMKIAEVLTGTIRYPSLFWCLALGLYSGITASDIPARFAEISTRAITVLVIFSMTLALANFFGTIFSNFLQKTNFPLTRTGLAQGMVQGSVFTAGFLIIMSLLGISVAPLLTALGVGGLAVALALQDTLANLFAGMQILMEQTVRVGDFIRLDTGQEGYVAGISWRTTRVRMLPNNMVVIPNSKLTQSVIINYYLPEKRMSLLVQVGVRYGTDPELVERILIEEALAAAAEAPGLLTEPPPFVRFIPGFGESSLDFTLICQVAEFTDQYLAQHIIRKRIIRRFAAEGIVIPFPQRTVHLRGEQPAPQPGVTV